MADRIRFGPFEFDPTVGTLQSFEGESGANAGARLPPQPAQLLTLLLAHYPEIVTRETIRKRLWGDVEVDFDRSLHFCIRQIRSALRESAAAPKYIETIPRRGYRWCVEPERVARTEANAFTQSCATGNDATVEVAVKTETVAGAHDLITASRAQPIDRGREYLRWGISFLLVGVMGVLFVPQKLGPVRAQVPAAVRVAIMPFAIHHQEQSAFRGNNIAEHLLETLTRVGEGRLAVIGPTSTMAYDGVPQQLPELVADLRIDYVINGRFSTAEVDKVLVEVIRGADGAHIWVRYFKADENVTHIVEITTAAILEKLGVAGGVPRNARK